MAMSSGGHAEGTGEGLPTDTPDDESAKSGKSGKSGKPGKAGKSGKSGKSGFRRWLKEIVIVLVIALALSFVVKTFLFRPFFIPSSSMEQTLLVGDRIFANQIGPAFTGYQRGDIVVFKDTQGWLAPEEKAAPNVLESALVFVGVAPDPSNDYMIKRIIGMPGDRVTCCDAQGRISINGKVVDESYAVATAPDAYVPFDVTVPANSFWVMGDNRPNSADSRFHADAPGKGFISRQDVVGTASVIAWPLNRIRVLGNDKADY